ncbi:hypothetical protein BZA05DRAFT_222501 [Tricharina praecox]|uniref:uncharacterized protein n=1 Tax=Tricharina praecox TaxID=43433 RepID=UPI0022208D4F|nr:uncharacterized protein BZA05DRAFT_222501 [Tricharina praecox]KAI5855962.1 hypothetical protein BZA05DRAFT_222501 [Tricharina praecox]
MNFLFPFLFLFFSSATSVLGLLFGLSGVGVGVMFVFCDLFFCSVLIYLFINYQRSNFGPRRSLSFFFGRSNFLSFLLKGREGGFRGFCYLSASTLEASLPPHYFMLHAPQFPMERMESICRK